MDQETSSCSTSGRPSSSALSFETVLDSRITLTPFLVCNHSHCFSTLSVASCGVCRLYFRLHKFLVRSKGVLTRHNISTFISLSIRDNLSISVRLFDPELNVVLEDCTSNVALFITSGVVSEYACSLSGLFRPNSEDSGSFDGGNICDNVKHLFECFSTSASSRGELFSIPREGFFWHATCTSCSASCAFTSPREGMILCFLFSFLDISYGNGSFSVRLSGSDNWSVCSRAFARLVLASKGGNFNCVDNHLHYNDPPFVDVECACCVDDPITLGLDFGGDIAKAYVKGPGLPSLGSCNHNFILCNSFGLQFKMNDEIFHTLLLLLNCHGYFTGVKHIGDVYEKFDSFCGLISVGGFIGVNLRCNATFVNLHKAYYSGSLREPLETSFVTLNLECEECEAQSSAEEYTDHEAPFSDSDNEVILDLVSLVRNFKENDEPLLIIPSLPSGAQTRGLSDLAKRVGGLLKGVSQCVAKLHAVWDWPLDTLINSVATVGNWLEQNKEHVSTDVWACTMCPQVQKDVEKTLNDQTQILELLRESIKKVAGTVDGITSMNKSNMDYLEKRLQSLEKKKGSSSGSDNTHIISQLQSAIATMNRELQRIRDKVEKLNKPSRKPMPASTLEENVSSIGEQMSIPRAPLVGSDDDFPRSKPQPIVRISKHSGGDVTFEGSESSTESVKTSRIMASGTDEMHNAILGDIYLGTVKWSVSSGEGKILKGYPMPQSIWTNNDRMRNFASYFQYYTCDGLQFTITTTSVGMQGGTLMTCWDAMSCATKQKINSVIQLSNLPISFLHASESCRLEFYVDSPSIQHIMCLSGSEFSIGTLGTFYICIANVLNAAAETSQDVAVNTWVRFVNPRFSFYTLRHELQPQSNTNILSISGLESLEAIVAEGKWSTTSSANLMEITVHPTACHISNGLVTQTALSVVSHLFNRWRGSLIYKFIFGASMFVKGKLVICAVPVAFRLNKMTVSEITAFPNIVCDLSTNKREFEFSVPYISIGENSLVCRDSLYDISSYNSELVVCRLHAVILDPLVMNSNASNNISFVVTLRPGQDFSLFDLSGVKTEFVDRVLKQSFHRTLSCGSLMGEGFSQWTKRKSVLIKFGLDSRKKNALCMMITPSYRSQSPCTTSLSWLSQIFVEWKGSLVYTLRAHSHKRDSSSLIRIWHDANGSTQTDEEFEFVSEVDPPAGSDVLYWDPFTGNDIQIVVPYKARTQKLLLHKARYDPKETDWIQFYNGMMVIDYEGQNDLKLELSIGAGSDFEMFEQTVAPRCGKVSNAFTKLSYEKSLRGITHFVLNNKRLSGPTNRAITTPVAFTPVDQVPTTYVNDGEEPIEESDATKPREGERAVDDVGNDLIFRNGEWDYLEAEKQMDCFGCTTGIRSVSELATKLNKNNTIEKVTSLAEHGSSLLENVNLDLPKMYESFKFLAPLLRRTEKFTGNIEEKLSHFESMREKIVHCISGLICESVPGITVASIKNQNYLWATIITILGGASLTWFCISKKKFLKKFSILCMIIWSPFLVHKVWEIGKWIKEKLWSFFDDSTDNEMCRKHSMADTFESAKSAFGTFTEWLSGNWVSVSQSFLTVLGVVASLIMWGSIPDSKKLVGFSSKFKEIGEKGRTINNIFSGFSSITKICSEWSKRLVSWVLRSGGSALPKSDSLLQQLVDFDIKQWVTETRELALQENRYHGFGSVEYITKVRHLYDKSMKIQRAILDGCKIDLQLSMIIKECKDKSLELLNQCYSLKGMKQPRIDPLHVCIVGAPGVGKSATSHVIIDNLLDHRGEPEVDRIYTRCCADQYWSNYQQEPVVLYDDLGAIATKVKMSDYAEIMGVKTNDPFSIPMAAVDEKGKHCVSKYIFSCTNVLELDDSGDVVTKLAYYRRRNVLVRVERDTDVARSEENPTQGLVFTVLGYEASEDGQRVEFSIKENWDESFLSNVNTEGWRFFRVDFKTFMKFLCTYTDAYMDSQEKLLKGIKSYRVNPFSVDDDTVAQAGDCADKVITMREMIAWFDEKGFVIDHFLSLINDGGVVPPTAWRDMKRVSFLELFNSMCGCGEEVACNFDYILKRIGDAVNAHHTKHFSSFFVVKNIGHIPQETTFKVKSIDFNGLNSLSWFHALATYYRWSIPTTMCPHHYSSLTALPLSNKCNSKEVLSEDVFLKPLPSYMIGARKIYIWKGVSKYFPSLYKTFGYICLDVSSELCYFTCERNENLDFSKEEFVKKRVIASGPDFLFDCTKLLSSHDDIVLKNLFCDIEDYGDESFSGDIKNSIEIVNEIYDKFEDRVAIVLHAICCKKRRHQELIVEHANISRHDNFIKRTNKLDSILERAKNVSDKTKIVLAIAGGISAVGVLLGLVFGLKSLFNCSLLEEENEECESNISSAGASAGFHTQHIVRGRHQPKLVVSTLVPEVASGQPSADFKTNHVISERRAPKVITCKSENGFGVTYDDGELSHLLRKERRKANKKNFVNAVKQVSNKGKLKKCDNENINGIVSWQDNIHVFGCISAGEETSNHIISKIVKKNSTCAGAESVGELTTHDEIFTHDTELISTIEELMKMEFTEVSDLVSNGTTMPIQKQAQVGDVGIVRDFNLIELNRTHVSKMSCLVLGKRDNKFFRFNVLRLRGSFVVMPAHYCEDIKDCQDLWFVSPNKVVKIVFEPRRLKLVSRLQDLIVWDLGSSVPPCTDYVKHISTEEDWKHYKSGEGLLSMTNYSSNVTMQFVNILDNIEMVGADVDVPTGTYDMCGSQHTILKGLRYRVHCMPGFCGAAVLRAGTKFVRKIIGMHVAGAKGKGVGYAEILTQESLIVAMEGLSKLHSLKTVTDDIPAIDFCEKQAVVIEGKGNLGLVGIVRATSLPNLPTKTSIIPSFIHGLIGNIASEPAILSTWDKRLGDKRGNWIPTLEGVKKYGATITPFPTEELLVVERHLCERFANFDNSLRKREINDIEVGINGIDGTDFWAPMPMDTSPGYPYVLRRPSGKTGKSWLFNELENYPTGRKRYEMQDEIFKRNFEEDLRLIKDGFVPQIITMECPKDERRKISKIYEKPATRTFTILPPEINLLFRMYFGDFAAMIMETRRSHFSQVGINPETLEWSELMNNFLTVGKRGFAGDYAKFDGVGSPNIYHSIVNVINYWYDDGDENARARHCLISSIVHRFGIAGEYLFKYSQGMPSGFSMTVIFNSFVNYYYMALAWQHIVGNSHLCPQRNLKDFDYFTKLIVYGDDNVIAVDEAFLETYNLRTVASYLSKYGITYTDDAKNPIHLSEPHVDITTVTFLKRSFVKVVNSGVLWKAPLNKDSIEERCNWIRECETPQEALYQNLDSALFEASIHGESYFENLKLRINEALKRVVLPCVTHTFQECNSRWWGNMTNYVYSCADLNQLVELSKHNELNLLSTFTSNMLGKDISVIDALNDAKVAPAAWYVP